MPRVSAEIPIPAPEGVFLRTDGVFGFVSWEGGRSDMPVGYLMEAGSGPSGDWKSVNPSGDPDAMGLGKPQTMEIRPSTSIKLPKPGASHRFRVRSYSVYRGGISYSPWSGECHFALMGVNPDVGEVVAYINFKAGSLDLPVRLALATAWTESGMRQYRSNGLLLVAYGDFGMMQLNSKYHRGMLGEEGWLSIVEDWRANVDYGLSYLKACYDTAIAGGEGSLGVKAFPGLTEEQCLAMAAYACYNGGAGAIARYRKGKDPRDAFFARYYSEAPWMW